MSRSESIVRGFGEEHVSRLTGLPVGQLRAWDRRGLFSPHFAYEDRRTPYSRVYSFRDVVGLRTIAVLRQRHRVTLAGLERTARALQAKGYRHWADVTLSVVNGQVHFRIPGSDVVEGVVDGQLAMLPIIEVIHDVEGRVRDLFERPPGQYGEVEQRRHVMRHAPVVAGTRIPTAAVRRLHEDGYPVAGILEEYPSLTEQDVRAALEFEAGRQPERRARSA